MPTYWCVAGPADSTGHRIVFLGDRSADLQRILKNKPGSVYLQYISHTVIHPTMLFRAAYMILTNRYYYTDTQREDYEAHFAGRNIIHLRTDYSLDFIKNCIECELEYYFGRHSINMNRSHSYSVNAVNYYFGGITFDKAGEQCDIIGTLHWC